jgi:RNA polymerase sigma-70 factor (ECF subfamily)
MKLTQHNENPPCVEALYHAYAAVLIEFATRLLHSKDDAADVVSDVFMRLLDKCPLFDSIDAASPFLYVSARNACYDLLRRQRRMDQYLASINCDEPSATMNEVEEAEMLLLERLRFIHAHMQDLSAQNRTIAIARFIDRKEYRAIADELGIEVSTVRNQASLALKNLRKALAKEAHNWHLSDYLLLGICYLLPLLKVLYLLLAGYDH